MTSVSPDPRARGITAPPAAPGQGVPTREERNGELNDPLHPAAVLIVDDESMVLAAVARLLRPTGIRVFTAAHGAEALELLEEHAGVIGVVISDYAMPAMNGAELLRAVRLRWPDVTRVLLTGNADLATAADAVNEGQLSRLFLKPWDPPVFQRAVLQVLDEHRLGRENRRLHALLDRAATAHRDARQEQASHVGPETTRHPSGRLLLPMGPLSRREIEVLQLLVHGRTNPEIGRELYLSAATVKVHVGHILAKLGVSHRTQAAVRALTLGLVASPTS